MMLDPVQDNKIDSIDDDISVKEYLDNSFVEMLNNLYYIVKTLS